MLDESDDGGFGNLFGNGDDYGSMYGPDVQDPYGLGFNNAQIITDPSGSYIQNSDGTWSLISGSNPGEGPGAGVALGGGGGGAGSAGRGGAGGLGNMLFGPRGGSLLDWASILGPLLGGVLGSRATSHAQDQMQNALNQSNTTLRDMFGSAQENLKPWTTLGLNAAQRMSTTPDLNLAGKFSAIPNEGALGSRFGPITNDGALAGRFSALGSGKGLKGFASGGRVDMTHGGKVSGPGGPTDDDIPAELSNGEFVMNAESTALHRPQLERWNHQGLTLRKLHHLCNGGAVRMAEGGAVDTRDPFGSVGDVTNVVDPNNMFQFLSRDDAGKWQFNALDPSDVRLEDTQFKQAYDRALAHKDSALDLANKGIFRGATGDESNAAQQVDFDRLYGDADYGNPYAGKKGWGMAQVGPSRGEQGFAMVRDQKGVTYDPKYGYITPQANMYHGGFDVMSLLPMIGMSLFSGGLLAPELAAAAGVSTATAGSALNAGMGLAQGEKPGIGTLAGLATGYGGYDLPAGTAGVLNALGNRSTPGLGSLAQLGGSAMGYSLPSWAAGAGNFAGGRVARGHADGGVVKEPYSQRFYVKDGQPVDAGVKISQQELLWSIGRGQSAIDHNKTMGRIGESANALLLPEQQNAISIYEQLYGKVPGEAKNLPGYSGSRSYADGGVVMSDDLLAADDSSGWIQKLRDLMGTSRAGVPIDPSSPVAKLSANNRQQYQDYVETMSMVGRKPMGFEDWLRQQGKKMAAGGMVTNSLEPPSTFPTPTNGDPGAPMRGRTGYPNSGMDMGAPMQGNTGMSPATLQQLIGQVMSASPMGRSAPMGLMQRDQGFRANNTGSPNLGASPFAGLQSALQGSGGIGPVMGMPGMTTGGMGARNSPFGNGMAGFEDWQGMDPGAARWGSATGGMGAPGAYQPHPSLPNETGGMDTGMDMGASGGLGSTLAQLMQNGRFGGMAPHPVQQPGRMYPSNFRGTLGGMPMFANGGMVRKYGGGAYVVGNDPPDPLTSAGSTYTAPAGVSDAGYPVAKVPLGDATAMLKPGSTLGAATPMPKPGNLPAPSNTSTPGYGYTPGAGSLAVGSLSPQDMAYMAYMRPQYMASHNNQDPWYSVLSGSGQDIANAINQTGAGDPSLLNNFNPATYSGSLRGLLGGYQAPQAMGFGAGQLVPMGAATPAAGGAAGAPGGSSLPPSATQQGAPGAPAGGAVGSAMGGSVGLPSAGYGVNVGDYLNPGIDFAMKQGMGGLQNSAASRGGLLSGGAMKDLMQYGTGLGLQNYNNAFNQAANVRDFNYGADMGDRNFFYNAANNDRNYNTALNQYNQQFDYNAANNDRNYNTALNQYNQQFGYNSAFNDANTNWGRMNTLANLGFGAQGQGNAMTTALAQMLSNNALSAGQVGAAGTMGQNSAIGGAMNSAIQNWIMRNLLGSYNIPGMSAAS